MPETAFRASGLLLVAGAALLAAGLVMLSFNPVIDAPMSPTASLLLLLSSIALLLSIPGMYARQAAESGWLGLTGYLLLQAGIVLLIVVASTPILYPSFNQPAPEHPVAFLLGIAMVIGLLLTAVVVIRAGVFPRTAGLLMLAATAGFFLDFFIAEFLPPVAGQLATAFLGLVLALSLAWIGLSLWTTQLQPAG